MVEQRFTDTEVARFQEQGFVIGRQLASPATIAAMRQVTQDGLLRDVPPIEYEADLRYPGAPTSREAEGGRTARRLKMAMARSPIFIDWLSTPPVLERLKQLLGPEVVCPLAHHNCIMTKQPAYSSDTGWHQDIRYWAFERPDLVNIWIALGPEHPGNGGLWLIPGSHREAFRRDQFDDALFFREDLPENGSLIASKVPVVLEPGDVLFFHCLALHAATRNQTEQSKLSVVFTFRGGGNRPRAGSRSASSPELHLTPGVS